MAAERRSYRHGVRAIAPLTIAAAGFGVSFGLLARAAGWGWLAPIVMSATTFAGSAQFASASIMSAGGTVAAAIAAGLLLNARYAPIGGTVAPWLGRPGVSGARGGCGRAAASRGFSPRWLGPRRGVGGARWAGLRGGAIGSPPPRGV